MLLVLVVKFVCLSEMAAHRPHLLGEGTDVPEQRLVLKVPQYVVAIIDRLHTAQRGVEEGLQVVFFAAGRDGRDNLVQIQVREEVGRFPPIDNRAGLGFVK